MTVEIPNPPLPSPRRPEVNFGLPLLGLRDGRWPNRGPRQPVGVGGLEQLDTVRVDESLLADAIAFELVAVEEVANGLGADAQPTCGLTYGKVSTRDVAGRQDGCLECFLHDLLPC
jgi:hypothetical protein